MIKNKLVAKPLTKRSFVKAQNSNIFQIVNKIKETVDKEQLIKSSSKILLSISGGQDSIFLLFCLSFLQSQLNFCFKIVWCNHFWQSDSFYTTLHLTKSAQAFSSPIVGFVPLGFATLALPYRALPQLEAKLFKKTKRGTSFAAYRGFDTQNLVLRAKSKHNRILCFLQKRKHNRIWLNTPLKKQKKFIEAVSEDTARNWRHITIERSYAFYNMNRCVYGHTLSDRVETILFNLIRGTGSRGAALLALKREHASFCYNKFFPCLEQLKKNTHLNNL